MTSPKKFDEEYFERGITSGRSLYEDYHWMPERSLCEAHWFAKAFDITRGDLVLDFGCAKGFFVHALRLLGYIAYGYDISTYAIEHCVPSVRGSVMDSFSFIPKCDFGFCKDVLEHCEDAEDLRFTLDRIKKSADEWLIIVPLARAGKYVIPEYEQDVTHVIRYDAEKWITAIKDVGFTIDHATTRWQGIKDHWQQRETLDGNLFVRCSCE